MAVSGRECQSYILRFHMDKPSTGGSSWTLPMTEAPLAYLLDRSGERVREILLFGNPLLWWAASLRLSTRCALALHAPWRARSS